jgi:two-component system phosphate regulon sensor histidine kinase PhoR
MKTHSLFVRLFAGNLLIFVLIVLASSLVSGWWLSDRQMHQSEEFQAEMTRFAAQTFENLWPLPPQDVQRICREFPDEAPPATAESARARPGGVPMRLTVVAHDGAVLGDSSTDPASMANHRTPDRTELLEALDHGRPGLSIRRSETIGQDYRYTAAPIRYHGEVVGAVRVAIPVAAIVEGNTVVRHVLLWIAGAMFVAFALLGLLINWIWYAPLRRITEAARRIAAGEYTGRVRIAGSPELVQLSDALNAMRDGLARQIEAMAAHRENLQMVVSNLREGVIAIDGQGRIVLANRAAGDLFGFAAADVVGRALQSVVRMPAVAEACNQALATGRPIDRQVDLDAPGGRRCLDVRVSRLSAGGPPEAIAALLMARDITGLVRTAAVKAEFVANASHELRTPLATIRAAVESLAPAEPGDDPDVEKLFDILRRQVTRLEDLTLDLLNLHTVESAKQPLALEVIVLDSLAARIRTLFADPASRKRVLLDLDVPTPAAIITTDRKLVEMILQNLVDNALKFTPGGGRVVVALRREADRLMMSVTDTGCGIRPEHKDRVFERFFQVDPSRSGEGRARGTGLGLAIVKHAADRLGAVVSLESELGRGTAVSVSVPDRS